MTTPEQLAGTLKDHGIRKTPQRLAIAEVVINSGDHPSVKEIFERVKEFFPYVTLATVYSTLAVLADEIPSLPYEEMKFTCPDEIKFDLNTALQADFTQRGYRVETIDGVKVWLDDGWVLLRPSNTQPVMRMFVEARTPERMLEIKAEFIKEYEKTLASLSG